MHVARLIFYFFFMLQKDFLSISHFLLFSYFLLYLFQFYKINDIYEIFRYWISKSHSSDTVMTFCTMAQLVNIVKAIKTNWVRVFTMLKIIFLLHFCSCLFFFPSSLWWWWCSLSLICVGTHSECQMQWPMFFRFRMHLSRTALLPLSIKNTADSFWRYNSINHPTQKTKGIV